jgi:hypothetical protein
VERLTYNREKPMFRLVAFALAVSALCAGASARADETEDRAVAFVEKIGGTTARDDKAPDNRSSPFLCRAGR